MTEPLILRARVRVPVAEVHKALTDAGALRSWLAEHAEVDLPHRFEFWGRYTPDGDAPHQRLLHADEHTLRFAWLLDGVETTTEIGLSTPDEHTTVITVAQTHFDIAEALAGTTVRGLLETFWSLSLMNLADYLEGRELTPKCDLTSSTLRAELTFPLLVGPTGIEPAFGNVGAADLELVSHEALYKRILLVEYRPSGRDIPRA